MAKSSVGAEALAQTPPRGWNSYDYYDNRITEDEFKACVDVLAEKLLPHGYDYAVIDYLWSNPKPEGWHRPDGSYGKADVPLDEDGVPQLRLAMDEHARLLPPTERFPSAANGAGFKPLADYVHSKGMKFGIHIMRGIPRQAYFDATPIKGTDATARDIGEPDDVCTWCNNMFGIDGSHPASQAYYDSLFELYASWGVDLVKADDLMSGVFHTSEMEMIHKALAKCGRPMVLSLSPGEAPLSRARFLTKNSNMWRISADFWDRWDHLHHSFFLLDAWTPFRSPGRWPDADMLPLGRLSRAGRPEGPERVSEFTEHEARTMMTLWCIARSPLMWGGDPLTSDPSVYELIANPEVLEANTYGRGARQSKRSSDRAVWISWDSRDESMYVGLFNLADYEQHVSFRFADEGIKGRFTARDLWSKTVEPVEGQLGAKLPPHGSAFYRLRELD